MNAYQFFLSQATHATAPDRIKGARALAKAERQARDAGMWFKWEIDPYSSSADWIADNEDGGQNCSPWQTWACCVCSPCDFPGRLSNLPAVKASLGGIDFGRGGEPWSNPYRRVVEAELAIEVLDREKEQP